MTQRTRERKIDIEIVGQFVRLRQADLPKPHSFQKVKKTEKGV